METLKQIAGLDKTRRYVFFVELFDTGHGKDFVKYLASLPEDVVTEFLAGFHKYEQDRIREDISGMGVVSEEEGQRSATYLQDVLNRLDELMEKQKKMTEDTVRQTTINRDFMKEWLTRDKAISDQVKGLPCPPLEKPVPEGSEVMELPKPTPDCLSSNDLYMAIEKRQSKRKFTDEPLSLEELSFLLWSTQGVKKVVANGQVSIRTVPSAGARHPFETYIGINNVTGLKPGIYRYLGIEHKLEFLFDDDKMVEHLVDVGVGQRFVGNCAACFIWSCIPYRGEWRYGVASHKNMLLDAGHVCQNLYLACEAIGCGTCAIGAYNQELADQYLKLDGNDEFVVYLSPVGKL